ncbi:MAG: M61 family metallopeptidase [Halofilum sp. (in: g-proteobacteria)]
MRYTLIPQDPRAHLFAGRLELGEPDPSGQCLSLPAWIPGSYMIRDFARHVVAVDAWSGQRPVRVEKRDKDTWRCEPCAGPLLVRWQVYAWDPSVRAAALDDTGGFCNGSSVLLQPLGVPDGPFELVLEAPAAPVRGQWRVATTMAADSVDPAGWGRYRARDYEELIDHPIRFGEFTRLHFEVVGVPHEVVLPGAPRVDAERLCADLAAVCRAHVDLFGGLPVERYVFFMNLVGSGYGGLEHRTSTVLDVARDALPLPDDPAGRESYLDLLGLCSHEYFHLWNVKRIRPAAFVPLDLSREVHTTLLWAFEGFTSYYDDLGLSRAGRLTHGQYLERLARVITRVHRGAGRFRQTVLESSFDAWTRFYKQDENAPNAIVSYYAKGALIALALDLTIRHRTDGTRSLDDVMRALWTRHGHGDGVPEQGIESIAREVTGLDLDTFFDTALRSTRDLDLATLLLPFGIELRWQASKPAGGYVPALGVGLDAAAELPRIARVFDGGPGRRAGLAPGDRIVAVDGVHRRGEALGAWLARLPAGSAITVHVLRDDRLHSLSAELQPAPADEADLVIDERAGDRAARRRAAWLDGA